MQDGGYIGASNNGTGSGGTAIINASEFIKITGERLDSRIVDGSVPSQINTGARCLGINRCLPTGDADSVVIYTPNLELANNGLISLLNDGVAPSC